MKNILTLIITLLISISSFAQQGINYKAVIKDDLGNVIAGQEIDVKFSIIEITDTTTTVVYTEDHPDIMTDANGIIILNIGEGTTTDVFANIDWGSDSHSLKTEIDLDNDTNYEDLGTTAFKAVPYALSSADNLWQLNGGNTIALTEKVGIGTITPSVSLQISDPENASLKLETVSTTDITGIRFENGPKTGEYTFFKIENREDRLRISVDSCFSFSAF